MLPVPAGNQLLLLARFLNQRLGGAISHIVGHDKTCVVMSLCTPVKRQPLQTKPLAPALAPAVLRTAGAGEVTANSYSKFKVIMMSNAYYLGVCSDDGATRQSNGAGSKVKPPVRQTKRPDEPYLPNCGFLELVGIVGNSVQAHTVTCTVAGQPARNSPPHLSVAYSAMQ